MDYNIHMNRNNYGFTLIELIVTLAVVSIVLVTGIPALNSMSINNRLSAQNNNILGSLNLARSEAIKRGRVTTICASSDSATCDTTEWKSGWIVFLDTNRNAILESASNDVMLRIEPKLAGRITLVLTHSDNAGVYQYKPDGSSRDQDADGTEQGTFTLCDADTDANKRARAININTLGRASRAQDTGGDKIVEDVTGNTNAKNVVCPQ